jgi:hypothetical protein
MVNLTQDEMDEMERERIGGVRIVAVAAIVGIFTFTSLLCWAAYLVWCIK